MQWLLLVVNLCMNLQMSTEWNFEIKERYVG